MTRSWAERSALTLSLLGAAAVVLMMLHIAAEIAMRSLFGTPLPGTITIVAQYYMPFAVFAPLALLEIRGGHIAVDVLADRLPAAGQRASAILARGLTFAVMAAMAWRTGLEAMSVAATRTSVTQGDTSIPVWAGYFILPLGAGAMALAALLRLVAALRGAPLAPPSPVDPRQEGL